MFAAFFALRLNVIIKILTAYILLLLLAPFSGVWGKPTTSAQARLAVKNWLALDPQPLSCPLGQQVRRVQAFGDAHGNPLYFVVYLQPTGLVIVPSDDLVEPIIAFSTADRYDPAPPNHLGILLSRDVAGRVSRVREMEEQFRARGEKFIPVGLDREAQRKWRLLAAETAPQASASGLPTVSDPRVPPLAQSYWSQGNEGAAWCYNYYTPNHWPCGCAATAMAQLMRFHRHPTAGVGSQIIQILVWNSQTQQFDIVDEPLLGGDGAGGPYDWNNMVLDPDASTTDVQRRAIGALTHDAGVSINTHYDPNQGDAILGGKNPFVNIFQYGNTIYGEAHPNNMPFADLVQMANPNLDAGLPVLMRVVGSSGAHYIVGDGYGYNFSTMYHHLNMGWGGSPGSSQNVWYNLPNIDSSPSFNTITTCWYNIYTSGTGEIISGMVVDDNSNSPLTNTQVVALGGGYTYSTQSNNRGIYALPNLPSNTGFKISAVSPGYDVDGVNVSTGLSVNNSTQVGNLWGQVIRLTKGQSLNQALDNYSLSFTTGGHAKWVVDTAQYYSGNSSGRSGVIGHNQSSWLQTIVVGPGTLSFNWRVASEWNCDFLELYIDDKLQAGRISGGGAGWQEKTFFIPAGTHFLKWVYVKDGSLSATEDAGWVDRVVYNKAQVPSLILPNLLAFFPFEGNAQDVSGNNRHGWVNGVTQVGGFEGQAYFFDGQISYIHVPLNINPFLYPKLTLGAWAKASSTNPTRQVLSCDNGSYDRSLCIDSRGGGTGWSAFCGTAGVLGYEAVALDKWVFLAVVYDQAAGTVKLYVDDKVHTATGATLGDGWYLLRIGQNPSYGEYFHGAIDNVFVFDNVLTPEQIAYIRAFGAAGILKGASLGKNVVPSILWPLLLSDD